MLKASLTKLLLARHGNIVFHQFRRCQITSAAPKRNLEIQDAIYSASSPREIADIIHFRMCEIDHSSIYGKAMQRCTKLLSRKGYKETVKEIKSIMDVLLHQHETSFLSIDSVVEYHIFFEAMIKMDRPDLCDSYFDDMVNRHGFRPNEFIFASMIKSCRSEGNYQRAEWYWSIMTEQYQLTPNTLIVTELMAVYSKCHQKEKAIALFHEYHLLADKQLMSAYLSVFTRCGDIEGMQGVIEMMKRRGYHPFDAAIYADIMTGYFNAKQIKQCLITYDELIASGINPNRTVLGLKCLSLCNVLQTEHHQLTTNQMMTIYAEIENMINVQYPLHRIVCEHQEYELLLRANILLNKYNDPMQSIKTLEEMLKMKQLVVMDRNGAIDLHRFFPITAVFVLRYFLKYRLENLIERNGDLWIIVGIGKHRSGANHKKGRLKQLVIHELECFDPPIDWKQHPTNDGVIVIEIESLIEFKKQREHD